MVEERDWHAPATVFNHFVTDGRRLGITNFLAHISSGNEGSIRFHARHGFTECGRFLKVGEKAGRTFDMVWTQRIED
ncbi:MAG: GNAT family N-acetyltransferase [Acidobacteriota bacterium]|nr:GNAT family N-acetyltransferase [Acidobacteriota bacterium]